MLGQMEGKEQALCPGEPCSQPSRGWGGNKRV